MLRRSSQGNPSVEGIKRKEEPKIERCYVGVSRLLMSLLFLLLIQLSHQNLRSLLLFGNNRDRIETLTQCAEWSQFLIDYVFSEI